MKKEVTVVFVTLFVLAVLGHGLVWTDVNASDFNNGTHHNTSYNGGSVSLVSQNKTGIFTSRVFNVSSPAAWSTFNWSGALPTAQSVFAVDAQGKVYASGDGGVSWSLRNSSYGRTADTQDMFADSANNLYILASSNREVWKSIDGGVSWVKINDTYSSLNLLAGVADANNTLYTIGGSAVGAVYASGDGGVSWSLRNSSYNGGSGGARGMTVNTTGGVFAVDAQGKVYASGDGGVSWSLRNSSYGRTADTQDMFADSANNLYILASSNREVWKSIDGGVSWVKINDTYSSLNLLAGVADANNTLYTIGGSAVGAVYASGDGGVSWSLRNSSYNGGSGGARGMTSVVLRSRLLFQIRNCSLSSCSDGVFVGPDETSSTYFNTTTFNFNKTGLYFQYRVYFSADDESISPQLINTSTIYTILNTAPRVSIAAPTVNGNYSNRTILLNFSIADSEANEQSCWYRLNSGPNISLPGCANTTFTAEEGSNTVVVYANDTTGATNSSSAAFEVDSIAPAIFYTSPTDANGSFVSRNYVVVNASSTDTHATNVSALLFTIEGVIAIASSPNSSALFTFSSLDDGVYFFNASAVDSYGNFNSTLSRTVIVDTTVPDITIWSPTGTFGYNTSILLNYSATDTNRASCWYRLDTGANQTLTNCGLMLLNLSEGSHTMWVYANDSAGNEGSSSKNFSIVIGAPTITLISPVDEIVNTSRVSFFFNAQDPDGLDYCELWGNFGGVFAVNQTSARQIFDQAFELNLSDGTYLWNIACADLLGFMAFNGNQSFSVDTIPPSVSVSSPSVQTSRTNIPLQFNVTDQSAVSCQYAVYRGQSVEIANTTVNCSSGSSSFNVTVDADFTVIFVASDAVGHTTSSNIIITITTTLPPVDNGGGNNGGGGGGGGGAVVIIPGRNASGNAHVSIDELGDIIVAPNEEKILEVRVRNDGGAFLNRCTLKTASEYEDWISSDESKNINMGEIAEFKFVLSIPPKATSLDEPILSLSCLETTTRVPLHIIILQPQITAFINSISQLGRRAIKINANIESSTTTHLGLQWRVLNADEETIFETSERIELASGSNTHETALDISEARKGLLKIVMLDISSSRVLVEEFFVFDGNGGLTGFAFLDTLDRTTTYIGLIALTTIALGIFITRRIVRSLRLARIKPMQAYEAPTERASGFDYSDYTHD